MNEISWRRVTATLDQDRNDQILKRGHDIVLKSCICNEIGIMQFNDGQHADAKGSFVKALTEEEKTALSYLNQSSNQQIFFLDAAPISVRNCGDSSAEKMQLPEKIKSSSRHKKHYDEGMDVYTVPSCTYDLQPKKLRCATLLYNIAQTCICCEEHEDGKAWLELALIMIDDCERGINDATLLHVKIQNNLGNCHYHLGHNEDAMKCYNQTVKYIRKFDLGKEHLAAAYNCLAIIHLHHKKSKLSKAFVLFQQSLSLYTQLLTGDFTREIGTLLNNIGRVHCMRSEFYEALEVYQEALKIRKALCKDSIDVAATVFNIAQTYNKIGVLDESMRLFKDFVYLMSSRFEECNNRRDIATAYKCMGRIFEQRGEIENARLMFEQALKSERIASNDCHVEMASTLNHLGFLCYNMNEANTALVYFQEGLRVEKTSLQSNISNVIVTLRNIAQIHYDNENYIEAIKAYNEAKKLQSKVHGKSSFEVASTLARLGQMYYLQKEFSSSLDCYQQALIMRQEYYGSEVHREIASTLNFIGLVLYKLMRYEDAKNVILQSMRIWEKLGEVSHKDFANLLYNMATISLELGEEEQAIKLYKESLRLEKTILGEDHKEICSALERLGKIHQQRGDFDEAVQYFSSALDVHRKDSGNTAASIFRLLNTIGNIHLMRGSVGEMMEYYVEAERLRKLMCQESERDFCAVAVTGYSFYALSKLHPTCAQVA